MVLCAHFAVRRFRRNRTFVNKTGAWHGGTVVQRWRGGRKRLSDLRCDSSAAKAVKILLRDVQNEYRKTLLLIVQIIMEQFPQEM
jgi:hypothetical protein